MHNGDSAKAYPAVHAAYDTIVYVLNCGPLSVAASVDQLVNSIEVSQEFYYDCAVAYCCVKERFYRSFAYLSHGYCGVCKRE